MQAIRVFLNVGLVIRVQGLFQRIGLSWRRKDEMILGMDRMPLKLATRIIKVWRLREPLPRVA